MSFENIIKGILSEEEIEFIKATIISPDFTSADTRNWVSWRGTIERDVLTKTATPDEIAQYDRIREIESFVEILAGNMPEDMFELIDYMDFNDERDAKTASKVFEKQTELDMQDAFFKKHMIESIKAQELDINDPFVSNLIDEIVSKRDTVQKGAKLDSILGTAKFDSINGYDFLAISSLILMETEAAKKNGKRINPDIKYIDKNLLHYLVVKNLFAMPVVVIKEEPEEELKNIYADNCPADAIRENIESMITAQKEYLEKGEEVPSELLIPREIVLSPKNMEFLINSDKVDYVAATETGNGVQFFWKKTNELPALEIVTEKREDGKFILTYIKEEATENKPEFVWDSKSDIGKSGVMMVSKKQDALEDICDAKFKM